MRTLDQAAARSVTAGIHQGGSHDDAFSERVRFSRDGVSMDRGGWTASARHASGRNRKRSRES
eukprot:2874891-Rhodomonas_salina.1